MKISFLFALVLAAPVWASAHQMECTNPVSTWPPMASKLVTTYEKLTELSELPPPFVSNLRYEITASIGADFVQLNAKDRDGNMIKSHGVDRAELRVETPNGVAEFICSRK